MNQYKVTRSYNKAKEDYLHKGNNGFEITCMILIISFIIGSGAFAIYETVKTIYKTIENQSVIYNLQVCFAQASYTPHSICNLHKGHATLRHMRNTP